MTMLRQLAWFKNIGLSATPCSWFKNNGISATLCSYVIYIRTSTYNKTSTKIRSSGYLRQTFWICINSILLVIQHFPHAPCTFSTWMKMITSPKFYADEEKSLPWFPNNEKQWVSLLVSPLSLLFHCVVLFCLFWFHDSVTHCSDLNVSGSKLFAFVFLFSSQFVFANL